MLTWELVDSATVPDDTRVVRLFRRGGEFSVRVEDRELMASGVHGSEDALARLACNGLAPRDGVRILVGGLGMGYTLAAALQLLGADAQVRVAELVPAVVEWNRTVLAHLAGAPLSDPRVEVLACDVGLVIREAREQYDAILLDVDNGPRGLTRSANDWLYAPRGLGAAHAALRDGGVLAVWSAGPDRAFTSRLRRAGFAVAEETVRARGERGGRRHVLWLARR